MRYCRIKYEEFLSSLYFYEYGVNHNISESCNLLYNPVHPHDSDTVCFYW